MSSSGPCTSLSHTVTPSAGWKLVFLSESEILDFARMFLPGFLHHTVSPAGSWERNLKHVTKHRPEVVTRPIQPCDLSLDKRSAS